MGIRLSVIAYSFLLLASCSSGEKTKFYVAKIDSLSNNLLCTCRNFESIDSSEIIGHLYEIELQTKALDSLVNDTVNPELAYYSYLKHSFSLFLEEDNKMISELKMAKKQLDDLKYDAENGLINNQQLQYYFEQEAQAINNLEIKTDLYLEKIIVQLNNYEILNLKVEKLLDSLSQI